MKIDDVPVTRLNRPSNSSEVAAATASSSRTPDGAAGFSDHACCTDPDRTNPAVTGYHHNERSLRLPIEIL